MLIMNTSTPTAPPDPDLQAQKEAFKHVRNLRGFYVHALQYGVVVAGLALINLFTSPARLWFLWVAFGWGIGVAVHGFRVLGRRRLFGPEWEKREVEKRLGRPL